MAKEQKIISGFEDGMFKPGNNVTRAELAVTLDKLMQFFITKDWLSFEVNEEYTFKYPPIWDIQDTTPKEARDYISYSFIDTRTNKESAELLCSFDKKNPRFTFVIGDVSSVRSRHYKKNGKLYGVDTARPTRSARVAWHLPKIQASLDLHTFTHALQAWYSAARV